MISVNRMNGHSSHTAFDGTLVEHIFTQQPTMFKQLFFIIILTVSVGISNAQLTYANLKVEFDSAWICNHLQLIPVRYKTDPVRDNSIPTNYLSLAKAMQQKKVQIRENYFEGNADVRSIIIKNNSKENVLVMDGDLLKGGKQDRMISETKFIPPGKEVEYLNVFCIEKGRWSNKPKTFSYAGFAGNNLRKIADSTAIQQHLWTEIERQFVQGNTASTTFPYLEIQKQALNKDTACMNYFIKKLAASDSSFAGFIAVSDTTIIGCDLFASSNLTTSSFSNLLQAYMQAANHNDTKPLIIPNKKLNDFTDKLLSNEDKQKLFLQHHGKIFLQNKKPLHITAYGN